MLAKGGEGAGKSVAGIIKGLERVQRGMSGIMVSPDLPHFKKSLWPEFRRWCPWEMVVESQRQRQNPEWTPHEAFEMVFVNGVSILCGGIESPMSWEGGNVNWVHIDEARRCPDASALKVLDGRVRIPGPHGEPPQMWLTTTPRMNWLHEYFGPIQSGDMRESFKRAASVITLSTLENEREGNLEAGFVGKRRQSLNEAEARVLLEAEWEDIDNTNRFLPDMTLWDACRESLPTLGKEPMVLALDAGWANDSFGMTGVTRHPARHADVAIRFSQNWIPPKSGTLNFQGSEDFPGPERVLRRLCQTYNIVCCAYDPAQLVDMAGRLSAEGIVWMREFPQGADRLEADKALYDLIVNRRLAHDGNPTLRQHVDNADRKPDPETRKLRIVKREGSLKVDLCVSLSMSARICLILDI